MFVARASFVLAGLVFALLMAEIGLRLVQPPERKAHIVTDPVRHHRLRPNWQGTVQGFPYRTNAFGFRERELATPKPAGLVRVLVLGDSFTEGGGLAEADTIPRRVEGALRASCPGVEVVNAGTASYSPIIEYLVLEDVIAPLAPDLVVLNLDMTDVHDDLIRTALADLDADGLPVRVPTDRRRETALLLPPVLPSAVRAVEDRMSGLVLWQAIRKSSTGRRVFGDLNLDEPGLAARGLLGDLRYDRLAITRDTPARGEADAWATTARYLAGIQRLAARRGARLVVAVYPYPHQVAAHETPTGRARFGIGPGLYAADRPFRTVTALGERQGFAVISLLETFRRRADPARPLFRGDDVHHTAEGARVMADGIAASLLEAGLVPRCPR
jgi:lysophospholipase L1-like esterase